MELLERQGPFIDLYKKDITFIPQYTKVNGSDEGIMSVHCHNNGRPEEEVGMVRLTREQAVEFARRVLQEYRHQEGPCPKKK